MTRRLRRRLFASAALAIAGGAGAVHAQSRAPSPDGGAAAVSEVVVTAEKRTERLQDVAASVGVISGATLERIQSTTLQDWAGYVPGLTVADQGRRARVRSPSTASGRSAPPRKSASM